MWVYLTNTDLKNLRSCLGQLDQKAGSEKALVVTQNTSTIAGQLLKKLALQTRSQRTDLSAKVYELEQTVWLLCFAWLATIALFILFIALTL